MSRVTPLSPSAVQRDGGARRLAWLPVPAEEIGDLPADLTCVQWDGHGAYPTDPARVDFYAPPLTKDIGVIVRPLAQMTGLRVVQALSAGVDYLLPHLSPEVSLCNARGIHDAGTAEMALTLTLAALRGVPDFVRNQAVGRWPEESVPRCPAPRSSSSATARSARPSTNVCVLSAAR